MSPWLIIILIGLGTFALRASFIGFLGDAELPERLKQGLRFVPAAVLTAIMTPEILRPEGVIDLTLGNPRWPAAIVAALVAWKTRNIGATMVAGLAALWVLQAVL